MRASASWISLRSGGSTRVPVAPRWRTLTRRVSSRARIATPTQAGLWLKPQILGIRVIPGIAGQFVHAVAAAQFAEFTGVLVWQRERAAAQCLRRHVQQQRLGAETIADERANVVLDRICVDRVAVCLGSRQRHPLQVVALSAYVIMGP